MSGDGLHQLVSWNLGFEFNLVSRAVRPFLRKYLQLHPQASPTPLRESIESPSEIQPPFVPEAVIIQYNEFLIFSYPGADGLKTAIIEC